MGVTIPEGYGSVAMVHGGLGLPSLPYVWTFGVLPTEGEFTPEWAVSKCDQIGSAWAATIASQTSSQLELQEVRMTIHPAGGDVGTVVSSGGPWLGTRIGAVLPPNVACIVTKRTASVGRKGRGRFFLPMVLDESSVDNGGYLGSGIFASLQDAVDDFRVAIDDDAPAGLGVNMVLLHSGSETPSALTGLVVNRLVGTVRRRVR